MPFLEGKKNKNNLGMNVIEKKRITYRERHGTKVTEDQTRRLITRNSNSE